MRTKSAFWSATLGIAGLVLAGAANAEPSALVEDISSDRDDVQLFDYLEAGQVIELSAGETIVIGYLLSCVQETITGGKVTIGEDESVVVGGKREIADVDCDGGPVVAQVGAEQEAGAATFRNVDDAEAQRLLFGLSPLVRLSAPASELVVQRIDESEDVRRITATGLVVDMEKSGVVLSRGGMYRIKAGDREMVFKISRLAEEQGAPPVARLLPF